MNLLDDSGIQSVKENTNQIKNFTNNKKEKIISINKKEKNKSYRINKKIVLCACFILVIFFLYSILSSLNFSHDKDKQLSMLDYIIINNIKSIQLIDNQFKMVLKYHNENKLYKEYDLYKFDFQSVLLLVKKDFYELHLKSRYNVKNKINFYDLFSTVSHISDISIEKDIINNSLVIIGNFEEILDIFKVLDSYSFNFKLDLIKTTLFKKYYQLTIFND